MNFHDHEIGRLEGALKSTEHSGYQIVSYKVLIVMDMPRG